MNGKNQQQTGTVSTGSRSADTSRLNKRWELVILGVLVNVSLGTVYSWSVFREPLEVVFDITAAQSGLPYSVFLAAFAFSMPVAGLIIPRIGTRLTLLIGGVLVGLGWLSAGLVNSFTGLVFAYGLVGGAGVGFAYGVPLAVVGSWFPDRRGLAMGLTLTGFGVSPFVSAPAAELLIVGYGVRVAMMTFGVVFAVIIGAVFAFFVRATPVDTADTGNAGGPAKDNPDDKPVTAVGPKEMLRKRSFYGLWVTYVLGTLAGLTAIGLTASFGRQVVGLSAASAAAAVSAFGVMNGIGRPVFGMIHDRLSTRPTVVLAFLLIAAGAGITLLAEPGRAIAFFVGFAVLWLMLGGWLAIGPAATIRLFGPRRYAENYGIVYTAYGVGALLGGSASGSLYARFGGFSPMFVLIMGLSVVGIALALLFIPRGTEAD